MKKILTFVIVLNFICAPAHALIVDEFALKSLDSSLEIKTVPAKLCEDDFVKQSLPETLKIKNYNEKHLNFRDELVKNRTAMAPGAYKVRYIEDNFLPKTEKHIKKYRAAVDYAKKEQAVQIKIKNLLTTKKQLSEGDFVEFETVHDLDLGNKFYPKGTIVRGRIETVSPNGFSGVPADLILGNFTLGNLPLQGELQKKGKNHSVWVYPCAYVGSFFFGAGVIFLLVKGGQAQISPEEVFTVYVQN